MKKYKNFDELPLTMTVEDVAEVLEICLANAYALCHSKDFPCVRIGRRMIIPKPAFIKWMESPIGGSIQ